MMLSFDHLAVTALTLDEGVASVEAALGIAMAGGGKHAHMGTHNRLLGLGDLYLEVIATDPDAPPPAWPRWFDMDRFTGPPRLTNWVSRTGDIAAAISACPPGIGTPVALSRGDFRWEMAVPADGCLPFDGAFPALIQWHGHAHPASALPDAGIRLTRLEIAHPDATALTAALVPLFNDPRVIISQGAAKALQATFFTPHGRRMIR
jgi:Glyoxalase-like domain